ncbi:hypothetical protein K7X08_011813 [Anisodus acutangulus]|uniref:Uncharacterized protein n=1 Tax=Anisodus acutangulus TaxID=402998 RepID=A0A9Q1MQS0_9SOLA|nr:hypothetical protein K7X08_011813 [Anisodus acutangulus]
MARGRGRGPGRPRKDQITAFDSSVGARLPPKVTEKAKAPTKKKKTSAPSTSGVKDIVDDADLIMSVTEEGNCFQPASSVVISNGTVPSELGKSANPVLIPPELDEHVESVKDEVVTTPTTQVSASSNASSNTQPNLASLVIPTQQSPALDAIDFPVLSAEVLRKKICEGS